MKFQFLLFILFVVSPFVSCSVSSDIDDIECRLVRVTKDDVQWSTYTFDDNNKLVNQEIYNTDGELAFSIDFQYNIRDLIEETYYDHEGKTLLKYDYEYLGVDYDTIIRNYYTYNSSSNTFIHQNYTKYYFNESYSCRYNGSSTYNASNDELISYVEAKHSGEECNAEYVTFDADGSIEEIYLSYNDEENGAFYWVASPVSKHRSIHNKVGVTVRRNNLTMTSRSYRSTFTYNRRDYPLTEERVYEDGVTQSIKFEYE